MTRTSPPTAAIRAGLWCEVTAGNRPPVVFVHGFSVDLAMWDDQVTALAGRASTVRYDLRGFGQSGTPSPEHDHLSDLVALLDELGLDRVVVVGLSLGANVALALAAHQPHRVVAGVLASPGLPGRAWATSRPPDVALAHAREHGVEAAREYWLKHPLFDSTRERPAAFARLTRMLDRFPGHQWSTGPQSRPLPSLVEQVEQVDVPIEVVSGERDDPGYLDIAAELAERLPRARRTVIAGAGHFVNLDEPQEFNRVLHNVVADAQANKEIQGGQRT